MSRQSKNKRFTEADLENMGLKKNDDGTYSKVTNWVSSSEKRLKDSLQSDLEKALYGVLDKKHENIIEFDVDPMGKPRMTQSDKWRKRPVTDRYWELKRHLKNIAGQYNFTMPESNYHMIFYIPMPKSWPPSRKEKMNNMPHQQKPDKDNLEKAVLDALCAEDSYVWDGRVSKYWGYKGKIIIKY